MKVQTLKRALEARGGKAVVTTEYMRPNEFHPAGRTIINLTGELSGYDVELNGGDDGESNFFTARHASKRGEYDMGSDYNPGNYMFLHRIKDLDWLLER